MATIEFKGIEAYQKKLRALGAKGDSACRYAIYDAAGMVLDELKKATPVDTGDLRASEGLSGMKNKDGYIYAQIEFAGVDRKGAPNAVKARVLESGSQKRKKHPFIRPTLRRVQPLAQAMMEKSLDEYLKNFMRK